MLKYFKKYYLNFLLIVILIAGQVMVSLSIPKYMAKMINIGINQKGISTFIYQRLDKESFESFKQLADDEELSLLNDSYFFESGYYQLKVSSKKLEHFTLKVNHYLLNIDDYDVDNLSNNLKMLNADLIYQKHLATNLKDSSLTYIKEQGLEMLMIALSGLVFVILASLSASYFATRVAKDLRDQIFIKIQSFSSLELDKFSLASLITRTVNDTIKIQQLLNFCIRFIVLSPLMAIGAIIQSFSISFNLLWILVLVILVMVISISLIVFKIASKFSYLQKLNDKITLKLKESLSGLKTIRALNTLALQSQEFDMINQEIKDNYLAIAKIMALINPLMLFVLNISAVMIVYFGSHLINLGQLEIGSMLAFIQFLSQVIFSFMLAGMLFFTLPQIFASLKRIDEVLITDNVIVDGFLKASEEFKLEFKNVSFAYSDNAFNALENLSFKLKKKESLAFIGGTGSGKSTIAKLLLRLYDLKQGEILINDINLKDYQNASLKNKIALITQKAEIFNMSIADNIILDQKKDMAKLNQVINIACLDEFINSKEEKYDYLVLEKGANLSGGQKQRLAIARALYQEADLLFFDDAFSALDYQTELKLRQNIKKYYPDIAMIIVASKVSSIKNADQIIVLDKAKVMGFGNHQFLMENCAIYKEIALSQLQEYNG